MDTYTRELKAELKALREEVAELRPPAITKEEILSVKDRKKRLALIEEHMDLFKGGNR